MLGLTNHHNHNHIFNQHLTLGLLLGTKLCLRHHHKVENSLIMIRGGSLLIMVIKL